MVHGLLTNNSNNVSVCAFTTDLHFKHYVYMCWAPPQKYLMAVLCDYIHCTQENTDTADTARRSIWFCAMLGSASLHHTADSARSTLNFSLSLPAESFHSVSHGLSRWTV